MSDKTHARRCTAKSKRSGHRCRRYPTRGASVCYYHGGAIPAVKAAAARRLARERLDGDLGKLLAELEMDAADRHPVAVLLDAVARASAMTEVLGSLLGGLRAAPDAEGNGGLYGPDHLGDGRPHVLVEMYAQWTDRAARAAKLALDAGVDERKVRIREAEARQMAGVLSAVFADTELGLTATQRNVAAEVAARHLVALPGGAG